MTDQMSPADIPEEWLAVAIKAARWGNYSASNGSQWDQLRRSIAAVLPLHEQQVRARVAAELRAATFRCPTHNGRLAFNDGCIGCQRYAALVGAERIVAGRESPSVKAVREMRQAGTNGKGDN